MEFLGITNVSNINKFMQLADLAEIPYRLKSLLFCV